MLRFIRNSTVVCCGLAISSCSVFSPVQVGPTTTYVVNSVPSGSAKHAHKSVSLLVTLPEATPMYNTAEMAYSAGLYQQSYFAKNSWIEPPSQMLQPLIVQTLQNTHAFDAVSPSQEIGHFDYVVNTQILQFEQDFLSPQSVFRLALRVQLIDTGNNRIIATKEITVNEFAPQNTPYGGVVAANHATKKALLAIANFCLDKL